MLFSRQLALADVIYFCHIVRLNIDAGVPLVKAIRQLASSGPHKLRPIAARMGDCLQRGDSFRAALDQENVHFPPLLVTLAGVGESTGRLPEILGELEKYFALVQKSWRQVRSGSMLPVLQFLLGIGVIALLIFVLGTIAQSRGGEPQAVLGFRGASGAIQFLLCCAGAFAAVIAGYLVFTRVLNQRGRIDGILLKLPVVGSCLEAFAVARFSLALQLTLDTTLPIAKALRLSLEAAGNAVYVSRTEPILEAVGGGEDLTLALTRGQVFPKDFLSMVAIGEEGGRVVEILRHQAAHYQELAARRLNTLTRGLTGLIWLGYAAVMTAMILNLAGMYLRPLGG